MTFLDAGLAMDFHMGKGLRKLFGWLEDRDQSRPVTLLVVSLDRLSRNGNALISILSRLKAMNCSLDIIMCDPESGIEASDASKLAGSLFGTAMWALADSVGIDLAAHEETFRQECTKAGAADQDAIEKQEQLDTMAVIQALIDKHGIKTDA